MNKKSLSLLFSVVFMDMVGFGFIMPILPDYISRYGGNQLLFGFLLAAYALGQFISAPIVGRLSDRFGRKPLLLISISGTFLSLMLLGFAGSIVLVFAARILDGLTGGNITVAQSYIADLTDKKNRAKGMGLIGMAFGLGFVLGPLFGGILVVYGLHIPAFVAAGISGVNLLLIWLVLPESLPKEKRRRASSKRARQFSLGLMLEALKTPRAGLFLHLTFIFTLAFNMFETMFSAHAMQAISLSARTRSFVLAYVGVIVALTQGGGIGLLTRKFSEKQLLNTANGILAVSLFAWAFTSSLPMLLVVLLPLSVSAGITSVMIRSLLSKSVSEEEIGGTLGIASSIESLNRIIAPTLGGLFLGYVGTWAPGLFGALLIAWIALFLVRRVNGRISVMETEEELA